MVLIVFILVYLGMMLGHLPWLKVDRASIALGGAIALLAASELTQAQALDSIDFSTIGMLFGLQNMLIGERLHLSFAGYMAYTAVPALLSLVVVWLTLAFFYRGRWRLERAVAASASVPAGAVDAPALDRWETAKGMLVLGLVLYAFIFTDWNRGLVAASAGAFMLFNARFMSRSMLHRMDWGLLLLFIGLFVVNGAFQGTGVPQQLVADLKTAGFNLQHSDVLYAMSAILSDITSNVPTVMLLLPYASDPTAGPLMALASGLSSNLIVIGSLANIIVVDAANAKGLNISFWEFAKVGVPVALTTLMIAWVWVRYLTCCGDCDA